MILKCNVVDFITGNISSALIETKSCCFDERTNCTIIHPSDMTVNPLYVMAKECEDHNKFIMDIFSKHDVNVEVSRPCISISNNVFDIFSVDYIVERVKVLSDNARI